MDGVIGIGENSQMARYAHVSLNMSIKRPESDYSSVKAM